MPIQNYGKKFIDLALNHEYSMTLKSGKVKTCTIQIVGETEKAYKFAIRILSPIARIGERVTNEWIPKSKCSMLDTNIVRLTDGPQALTFAKFSEVVHVAYGLENFGCRV